MVLVGDGPDAADDWIAEHISAVDVCVTSDIPLASRCIKKGTRVVSPTGKQWTQANIGNALAGREIARHLRELGTTTCGPAPLTKNPPRARPCSPYTRAKKLSRAAESLVYSLTPSGVLVENHPKNRGFGGILRGQKCLQRGQNAQRDVFH